MVSSIYPLSSERRAHYEKLAAAAEPYDVPDDELIIDDCRIPHENSARIEATNARFVLRQDDLVRKGKNPTT